MIYKKQFRLVICFSIIIAYSNLNCEAQVGIGVNNPAIGTLLHVEDLTGIEKSGVLFPKVFLTDINETDPLPEAIKGGTLVYNTNADLQTGYYYWTVTKWQRLNAATGSMAKYVNDFKHNGNNLHDTLVDTEARLFGRNISPQFNDDPELYISNNRMEVTVKKAGRYQITVNMSFIATLDKALVESRLFVEDINGTNAVGPFYRSSEMVPTTGSERGSISFTQTLNLEANSTLTVRCRRSSQANTGKVVFSDVGTSSFFIEKLF